MSPFDWNLRGWLAWSSTDRNDIQEYAGWWIHLFLGLYLYRKKAKPGWVEEKDLFDERLEALSDKVRRGIAIDFCEVLEVIEYQDRLKEQREKQTLKYRLMHAFSR